VRVTWRRGTALFLASGTLALTIAQGAVAQDASRNTLQAASQSQDQNVQPDRSVSADNSSDEPMSLADAARLARSQKQSEPKASKVVDDDNLPRTGGGVSVVGSSPADSSADPAGRSSGSRGGKVVLLDFAASWCGPCRESLPDLKRLQAAYGSDELEVISIGEDKNENAWHNFVAENQINWSQRFDSGGEMLRQYGVSVFPTFILTDDRGTVLQRFVGEDPNVPLASRIAPYVKNPAQMALKAGNS